jgi:hypothetical protein
MSESSFLEQLQSHVGGLVRVGELDSRLVASAFSGKIGLLMGVNTAFAITVGDGAQWVELLIDGSVRSFSLYPDHIELIGADDA